ncbi:DUF58 domain-containing protein [Halalkalibacter alkalisediminis]|uniref:DUF58 domain-containing protein n=1 Tax=Halalkalibacter alkalisediminis TaxID=935616 RepID=A0ABV6NKU0_9BACI|nr:DUF58 domain-containing protein [Halalkalibacter alkalisediminis]
MSVKWLERFRPYIKLVFLLIFVLTVFSYAMFQGGFVSWFLFYSVMTVLVFTILVAIYPFRVKCVEREVSKEVLQAGENLTITITVYKRALQPFFFVRIQDVIPPNLGNYEESGFLFFFSFQRKLVFSYTVYDVKRGSHTFEKLTLAFGDLFGLFERKSTLDFETTVVVYPHFQKLKKIPAEGRPRQLEGMHIRQSFEEDRSLAGVRQYVPGDRLTSIDWKQSARSSHLMTKEFESYQGEGVVVAFDSYCNLATERKFEQSIELAASLVATFTEKQTFPNMAVRSHNWMCLNVTERSIGQGLLLLAKVVATNQSVKVIDGIYREWQGMHVYFVCSELNKQVVKACSTMIDQGVVLTLCLVSLMDQDRVHLQDLENLGVSLFITNE